MSVFHDGGTAIVIHAREDDCKIAAAGNSSPRILAALLRDSGIDDDPEWVSLRDRMKMRSSKRGLLMDWAKQGVKIVHSDELDLDTPQTSGMTRAAAITHARAGANKLWAGTMLVQPDAKTGPHHHGELETVLYVVKGRVRMRWGEQLEFSDEARPGDFIYVPPYVPHQEINASPDQICEAVVVRDGQDPIVVNLDLRTPEPASAGHPGMPFHPDR